MSEFLPEEDWEPGVEELLLEVYEIVTRIEARLESLESRQILGRREG